MEVYTFENKDYYLADDVYNEEPISFIGCSKTSRLIIKKKDLKQEYYIYMKYIKSLKKWEISEEKYKTAKLFITTEWTHNNLIKFKENKTKEDLDLEAMIAPPILDLEDDEKFRDINGNILDIEVRGDRNINDIYFKVKDISEKFDMKGLDCILLHKDGAYEKNKHYITFYQSKKLTNNQDISIKNNNTKTLFLTYLGMIRVLFCSRNKNAEIFQEWAIKILFTHQLGDQEDKEELAASLLGVHVKNVRQVFSLTKSYIPGVYLILCGSARDILNNNDYSDSDIVCKFGCSDNINRRLREHKNNLSKEFNRDLEVLCYSIIDPKFIFDAENSIKQHFKGNLVKYKNMEEIIVINKKDLYEIKKYYDMIHKSYIGCYEELHDKITELKDKLKDKNIELELRNKDIELERERHKNEINNKIIELKDKDLELLQYKIKLLENNIKL